ncbi:MAG TPA: uroporphyrinogen decarboxylase [Longimicrobium sp.]|nr:uroporphyrinogen decarboxylase [Longimicrobium sp.]
MNDLLLRACRHEPVERPPVWMMRQAGRYMPEYRAVRKRADFLTMVKTPELAVEVTMQPIDAFNMDAAIVFSDILTLPQAMGMELTMEDGAGPQFPQPLRSRADFSRLRDVSPEEGLPHVLAAIRLLRRELAGRVPLIGFAGAPWTLLTYMVEGGSTKTFSLCKRLLAEDPAAAHALLSRLAGAAGWFLHAQVAAGAQMVQIFESSAAALSPRDFRTFSLPYLAQAVRIARTAGAPVCVFALGAGWALEEIAEETGAEVIGVDWQTQASDARRRLDPFGVTLQGNFEPTWLFSTPEVIRQRTLEMLRDFGRSGYIANLGHGILQHTPVENVRAFVETVQQWDGVSVHEVDAGRPATPLREAIPLRRARAG